MIVVRYADDTIVGFQHRREAERFLGDLKDRLAQFALSLHPEKTRLIEFSAYAAERRQRRGGRDSLAVRDRCAIANLMARALVG
jgi:RNA-directed DNA polymerase